MRNSASNSLTSSVKNLYASLPSPSKWVSKKTAYAGGLIAGTVATGYALWKCEKTRAVISSAADQLAKASQGVTKHMNTRKVSRLGTNKNLLIAGALVISAAVLAALLWRCCSKKRNDWNKANEYLNPTSNTDGWDASQIDVEFSDN